MTLSRHFSNSVGCLQFTLNFLTAVQCFTTQFGDRCCIRLHISLVVPILVPAPSVVTEVLFIQSILCFVQIYQVRKKFVTQCFQLLLHTKNVPQITINQHLLNVHKYNQLSLLIDISLFI